MEFHPDKYRMLTTRKKNPTGTSLINNIDKLEMIERRAARYVLDRYHYSASVTEMLNELGWKSLEERSKHMRLTIMYRITNSLVAINVTN